MRDLVYALDNGTTVRTLREAQLSGHEYTMKCVEVKERKPQMVSEKKLNAMRKAVK